jgi:hypothetical protein
MPEPDPHDELGLPRDASPEEIQRAFRRRLREYHPDVRAPGDEASDFASDLALQRLLTAYASLSRRARLAAQVPIDDQPAAPTQRPTRRPTHSQGQPPLRATPVQWIPQEPERPARLRQPTHAGISVNTLIRWLS